MHIIHHAREQRSHIYRPQHITKIAANQDLYNEVFAQSIDLGNLFPQEVLSAQADRIDYYKPHPQYVQHPFSYVISDINSHDKWSYGYRNCIGLALSGIDSNTQKTISCLAHIFPVYLLRHRDIQQKFTDDLRATLSLMQDVTINPTDVVIFGGDYIPHCIRYKHPYQGIDSRHEYTRAVSLLVDIISHEIDNEPKIAAPSMRNICKDAYLETRQNTLHITTPDDITPGNLPLIPDAFLGYCEFNICHLNNITTVRDQALTRKPHITTLQEARATLEKRVHFYDNNPTTPIIAPLSVE